MNLKRKAMLPDKLIELTSAVPGGVDPALVGKLMTNRHRLHKYADCWMVRGLVDGRSVIQQGYIDGNGSRCTKICFESEKETSASTPLSKQKYLAYSSHASLGNFFNRKHFLTELPDTVPFTYDEENCPDGVYNKMVLEATNEFNAGIEYVRKCFAFEELKTLIETSHALCDYDLEELREALELLGFMCANN